MRIKSNTRVEIGRLFSSLHYGEGIACDCAERQAAMASGRKRHFFLTQAQQERHHARVFSRVVLCLAPRGGGQVPLALHAYRSRLQRACQRNDFAETLVGQQVVLESVGELILQRMDAKFDQRRIGFKRIRKILLAQERGHLAFGTRLLQNLLQSNEVKQERVQETVAEYLRLADNLLVELQPVFDVVGADAKWYRVELRQRVTDSVRLSP